MSHKTWNIEARQSTFFTSVRMLAFLTIVALLTVGIANAQVMRGHLGGEEGEESEPESEAPGEPIDIGEGPSIPEDVSVPLPTEVPPPLALPWENELPLVGEESPDSIAPTIASPEEEEPALTIPPPAPSGEMPALPFSESPDPTASEMTIPPPAEGGYGGTLPLTNPAETSGLPTMGTVPPAPAPAVEDETTIPPGEIEIDPTDDVITRLKKERYNEALRLYQMFQTEVRQGTAGLDELVRAHRTLMTAQLALTDSSQDRIAIRQAYLQACEQCEQEAKAKHEAGLASFSAVQLAAMERSNAELDLEQEIERATASAPSNPYLLHPAETMPSTMGVPTSPRTQPETISPGVVSSTESPTYYGPGYQQGQSVNPAVPSTSVPSSTGAPCPCETRVYGSPYRSGVIYYSPSRTRIRTWEQRVIGW